jgi:HAD superfamily hydrolase (TIGR01509 family)
MNIIIPIGGKGERFKNTHKQPKPLIPIYGVAMVEYVIQHLTTYFSATEPNAYHIYLIYKPEIQDVVAELCQAYSNTYSICLDYETSGAAETVLYGLERIHSQYTKCLLIDCDTVYTTNIVAIANLYPASNMVLYTQNTNPKPLYSYIRLNESNQIIGIAEKQKISDCANTGCYYFNNLEILKKYCRRVLDENIRFNGEPYMSCVIDLMIRNNHIFYGHHLTEHQCISLGTPDDVSAYLDKTHVYLFDLDGTLVLTEKVYFKVWQQLLCEFGVKLDQTMYDKYIAGNSDKHVIAALIPQADISYISTQKDAMFIQHMDDIQVVDGVVEYIRELYVHGNPISIVTNCNRTVANAILRKLNMDMYIDTLIVGGECANAKPHPEPYACAIAKYGVSNNRVIIFEDSKSGLLSACGVNPLLVVGVETMYTHDELVEYGAHTTIQNFLNVDLNISILKKDNLEMLKQMIGQTYKHAFHSDVVSFELDETKMKGGFISDVLKVRFELENGHTQSCVLKLTNQNETDLCKMANELKLYERENNFYGLMKQYININTPKCFGLLKNQRFETLGILMDDLLSEDKCGKYVLNLNLNDESVEVSFQVISELAKMHAKFWNNETAMKEFRLMKHNDSTFCPKWKQFMDSKWHIFVENWKHMLSTSDLEYAKCVLDNFTETQNQLSTGNLTLIHGDVKSPNIFYYDVKKVPYFIDWQYVAMGKGVQDVIFFLIESFDLVNLKINYHLFIHYYYVILKQYGIVYNYDGFMHDVKNALWHFPFFVAIWFGTVPTDELIDKNFPYFFIQKLFALYRMIG